MLQIIWEVPTETQITKTNSRRDRTCNRSISTKEPELVINLVKKKKKFPQRKVQNQRASLVNFTKCLKKN